MDSTPLLSVKELQSLLSVVNEEDKSFEQVSALLNKSFAKGDLFRAGCCMVLMLQENLLGKQSSRLISYYLLFDVYRSEPVASNPFLPVFIDALSRKELDPTERSFLAQLLSNTSKEVSALQRIPSLAYLGVHTSS